MHLLVAPVWKLSLLLPRASYTLIVVTGRKCFYTELAVTCCVRNVCNCSLDKSNMKCRYCHQANLGHRIEIKDIRYFVFLL